MKRIVITGGSGFLGRALTDELLRAGYEIVWLGRNPETTRDVPSGVRVEKWDGRTAQGWGALADGAFAIVNLAGESIGIPPIPWTNERKRRIRDSRVNAGKAMVEAVRLARVKPRVVIQASGVGYYGARGEEIITEKNSAGDDFLGDVATQWEASSAQVEALGVRRAIIRTGLPLDKSDGVFPYLALPFRLFFGGPIGSGRQFIAWIHLADYVRAIQFLIENENARGVFNLTAPNPLTNADFGRALARVLHRPFWFPVPGFALKLALGEMAELLLLSGQRAVPERLLRAGFKFQFANADNALKDVLK
ncbi:MAG: TIGR01777 family protein [Chloroflexi bacterium]|nr:TIGR01777 family protein [Chloroflexota bacterium]